MQVVTLRQETAPPLDHALETASSLARSNLLDKGRSQSLCFATVLLRAVFLSFVPKVSRM